MPFLDHFSLLAPVYDLFIGVRPPDRLAELLSLPIQGKLLDAAGGTGRVSQMLVDRTGGVVIADESGGMLAKAGEKFCCDLARSQTEALPFPDFAFERIIMVDALHHVKDQPGTIRELWRVLAPDGRIVIEDMNLHRLSVKAVALGEKLALMRSHFLYPEAIAALFSFTGSHAQVFVDGWTVWVVVDKQED
jgi:demethylmenaquinone methyltransferase/2-methoxy-6-polyprenyl-1,4-benzoquinol methylase